MAEFEWDERKNRLNVEKHSISFTEASEVFADTDRIIYPGRATPGKEKRLLTVGKFAGKFIIAFVYTFRSALIRIISARSARKEELREYLTNKLNKSAKDD